MIREMSFGIALVVAGFLTGAAVAGDSVRAIAAPVNNAAAPYVHTVIFHLKKDAPVEKIIEGCHTLTAIPTVRASTPADLRRPMSPRKKSWFETTM